MTQYHIATREDGTQYSARCVARVRACPVGGGHFSSKAEADLHLPEPIYAMDSATGKLRNVTPKGYVSVEKMADNAEYAEFLRKFVAENGESATSIYHSHAGVEVSRAAMIEEIERLKARDLASGKYYNADLVLDLQHDLYRADAAALTAKKENFRAAYEAYRAEHGPAVRPNFRQLVADSEVKRSQAAAQRESDAKVTRQKLSRVQGAKRLRNAQEDVAFTFGKKHSNPNEDSRFFGEQVPAVAIGSALGEFVTEGKETISDFFAGAKDDVRSLFGR